MPKVVRSTDELIENNITGALLPASGTTGERPGTPINGQIRYNTTTPGLEIYVNAAWSTLAAASGLGSYVRRDGDTMIGDLTFTNTFQLLADETGTAAAPAIAFLTDATTGIYRAGAGIVGITGDGAAVAFFDGVPVSVNHFSFVNAITNETPILTNIGTDTLGIGLGLIIRGKTATAAGVGGQIQIEGGIGFDTGAGGAITFTGGQAGATSGAGGAATITGGLGVTTGVGGAASLIGGQGGATNAAGGEAHIHGGAGQGTGAGGEAHIEGGSSGAGLTGTGGEVHVHGGDSAATNGAGGEAHFHGGAGIGTGVGGNATLIGGATGATGTGGIASLTGGAGAAGATAGSVTIDAGADGGGAPGSVTIAGTDGSLILGTTSFPVGAIADSSILVYDSANILTAITATTGAATQQILQFDDSGDTFSWINKATLFGFSTVTGDTGSATAELTDSLLLSGAANGGITTVATDDPEVVTFSITPVDLTTTAVTIAAGDFIIVSDSADTTATVALKATFTQTFNDLGVPFTGGTLDAADYLLLAGGTMTGAIVADDAGLVATPDIAWTSDLDTGFAQIGAADTLSVVAGGAEVAQFDGTAVTAVNFFTLSNSATGVTPVISNSGTDTTGIGLGLAFTAKAASASGNGGPVTATGGAANTTGVGGAVTFTGGAGAGASAGGLASLVGGAAGATGIGGAVNVDAGDGGATSGAGGLIAFTAGNGTGAALGVGGALTGDSGGSAAHTTGTADAGGAITFTAGQPGAATSGIGGLGGTISLLGAIGGATSLDTGVGGAGSTIAITGGAGGASDTGAASVGGVGGDVTITAGAGGSGNAGTGGLGANVVVTPGTAGEAGDGDGAIILATKEIPLIQRFADVVADSGSSVNVTEAELYGGYHIKDPAGAISYQVPNGTEISAYFPGTPTVGDSFEWTLINSGNVTAENITLTVDTGVTFAGGSTANILAPYADISTSIKHTQTWLVVNTGANTWLFIPK